jgi:hypothetical protein
MRFFVFLLVFLTGTTLSVFAQEDDCALDEQLVLQAVENVCANLGANEVCYGNFQVNAIPRDPSAELLFANPGDSTNLSNLRSLYLSSLNPTTSTWGIAQIRLLLTAPEGLQDVSMLLFGDVTIENASDAGMLFDVSVRTVAADILNTADPNALVLETVDQGVILAAVGRTTDLFWLRVQNRVTGNTGWIATELVRVVDPANDLNSLPVQGADTPFYGPMQAFYFSNGAGSDCANVATDGLLIQTPEGMARVSLLINEVSIELNASPEGEGATAFIQANPEEETGMSISVLTGEATVQSGDSQPQVVTSGMQTTIPLQLDLSPVGAPSAPVTFNPQNVRVDSLLPVLRAPAAQRPLVDSSGNLNLSMPSNSTGSQSGTGSIAIGSTSGTSPSGTTGNTGSGTGGSVSGSTTAGSQVASGSSGTSSDSSATGSLSGGFPSSGSSGSTGQSGQVEMTPTEGISVLNAVALGLIVLFGLLLLYWLIRYTGRSNPPESE